MILYQLLRICRCKHDDYNVQHWSPQCKVGRI